MLLRAGRCARGPGRVVCPCGDPHIPSDLRNCGHRGHEIGPAMCGHEKLVQQATSSLCTCF